MSGEVFGPRTRVYNQEERNVINQYKSQYMEATSPAARKDIAQMQIFPSLFNYWASIGEVIDTDEHKLRTNNLLSWLRNVWRTKKKSPMSENTQYKLTDVLWWTREADVLQEIASILNTESATTSTEGWFTQRTKASKNLINKMTDAEKVRLQDEADRLAVEGLPEKIQRKIAEEKWHSRLNKAARKSYREMGLVSMSVIVYTRKNGQLVVDIHDSISEMLGVPAKTFEDTYTDRAEDIQRSVLEYVIKLRAAKSSGAGAGADAGAGAGENVGTEANAGSHSDSVEIDPTTGFPIAPCPASLKNITKENLEKLYHSYMTKHYQLASQVNNRQAPFGWIGRKQFDFIEQKYIPRGLELNAPRTMKRDEMIKFFEHIRARQESALGIKDAFRFKGILSSRKKGKLLESRYEEWTDPAGRDPEPAPVSDRLATDQAPALTTAPEPASTPMPLTSAIPPEAPVPSPAPRPRPRPTQKSRDKSQADHSPQGIPSQYSFNTFETNIQSLLQNPDTPFLTLDPQFNVDRRIDLDPSLDPAFDGRPYLDTMGTLGSNSTPTLDQTFPRSLNMAQFTMPENTQYLNTPALTPEPDFPAPQEQDTSTPAPASRPRRKGMNADKLAISEAEKILRKGKTRR